MAGYLDTYGAGDARREKIVKIIVFSLLGLILVGGPLLFVFYDYQEEHQVKHFFQLLEAHDYQAAYAAWGCTQAKPCSGYPISAFMEDWGPKQDVSRARIIRSRSCGSGVILTVDIDTNREERLWVQRNDLSIAFSPFPGCPGLK
jgi:hypothetical protein